MRSEILIFMRSEILFFCFLNLDEDLGVIKLVF